MTKTANIKISSKFITVDGKRVGVSYSTGPWVAGVNPDLIKIRPRVGGSLSPLMPFFMIENNSDSREDYFENDSARVIPGHPLYDAIKLAAA